MRLHTLSAAFLAATLAVSGAHALPADQLYKRLSPSIWLVVTTDNLAKPIATGSAVVIGPEAMVTNCHVLRGAARIQVRHENVTQMATLQYPDLEHDLCQIHVTGLTALAVAIAPIASVVVGQRVYAIGAPRGLDSTLSDGLVSALRRDDQGVLHYIQTSAPISHGSSGGGLFNEDGLLIGITSSGVDAAQNLNFARPANLIADLPARGAAALASWQAPKPADPPHEPEKPAPQSTTGRPSFEGSYPALTTDALMNLPFRSEKMQQALATYMQKSSPKAFFVSDDGHYAWANGFKPKNRPGQPDDPYDRAMVNCSTKTLRPCVIFALDQKLVYGKR